MPQALGKLHHLAINLIFRRFDAVVDGFLQFRDNHPGEKAMQLIALGKLVGMAPDADAGLSAQELRMTIVNQKS